MAAVADRRRLCIYRIIVTAGELALEEGAQCWQDDTGKISGHGLWYGLLVPRPEDLEAQAKALDMSVLEWLQCKLANITYLKTEWK